MGNILIPKVEMIDSVFKNKLLTHIDTVVCNDMDMVFALDIIDKELHIKTLGIDSGICCKCCVIWKRDVNTSFRQRVIITIIKL